MNKQTLCQKYKLDITKEYTRISDNKVFSFIGNMQGCDSSYYLFLSIHNGIEEIEVKEEAELKQFKELL